MGPSNKSIGIGSASTESTEPTESMARLGTAKVKGWLGST
jgi:hypothetical protein